MVGASRIYLGVHYASDVVSGLSLGAAWSLLLSGLVARYEGRGL
jgi:membrane-associated phospholipid phosphatase